MNRKIIAYIATSADGYIARKDGSVEWLDRPRPKGNYDMGAFLESIDAIIWGRKTYEQSLGFGAAANMFGSHIQNYVLTHGEGEPAPQVTFVHEPVSEFARQLRAQPGRNIWMMGGAGAIAAFLDAGELDELMVHVVPVLIGEGIPLIAPGRRTVELELLSTKPFTDGSVLLHWGIRR